MVYDISKAFHKVIHSSLFKLCQFGVSPFSHSNLLPNDWGLSWCCVLDPLLFLVYGIATNIMYHVFLLAIDIILAFYSLIRYLNSESVEVVVWVAVCSFQSSYHFNQPTSSQLLCFWLGLNWYPLCHGLVLYHAYVLLVLDYGDAVYICFVAETLIFYKESNCCLPLIASWPHCWRKCCVHRSHSITSLSLVSHYCFW